MTLNDLERERFKVFAWGHFVKIVYSLIIFYLTAQSCRQWAISHGSNGSTDRDGLCGSNKDQTFFIIFGRHTAGKIWRTTSCFLPLTAGVMHANAWEGLGEGGVDAVTLFSKKGRVPH